MIVNRATSFGTWCLDRRWIVRIATDCRDDKLRDLICGRESCDNDGNNDSAIEQNNQVPQDIWQDNHCCSFSLYLTEGYDVIHTCTHEYILNTVPSIVSERSHCDFFRQNSFTMRLWCSRLYSLHHAGNLNTRQVTQYHGRKWGIQDSYYRLRLWRP